MCIGGGGFFKKILPLVALAAIPVAAGAFAPAAAGALGAEGAAGAGALTAAEGAFTPMLGETVMPSLFTTAASAGGGGLGAGSLLSETVMPSLFTTAAADGGLAASTLYPTASSGFGGIGDILTRGFNTAKDFFGNNNNTFWAGQALNAAGVYEKNKAAQEQQNYINSVAEQNYAKNKEFGQQADAVLQDNLNTFNIGNQLAGYATAADARNSAAQSNMLQNNSVMLPTSASAPVEVQADMARRINDSLQQGREQAKAGANLAAYGDLNNSNNLALQNSAIKLNQIGDFANGAQNVLNTQLATAPLKGTKSNTIGDVLQGAGALANAYSVTRPKVT